jgi:glycosyltransferase involved in cell wall biosynthesis
MSEEYAEKVRRIYDRWAAGDFSAGAEATRHTAPPVFAVSARRRARLCAFTPEITAAPVRLHPFAAGLAARGHEVEVVCEVPSHPQGIVYEGYGARLIESRELDGFRTTYVWTYARPSKRARHRLGSYASYAATATAVASARRRPDVVLASSPPLSVGAVGAIVAKRHRAAFVLDVRDLWPEVAVALGELSPGPVLRAAEILERRLYAAAALVTTPTESFREHIAALSPDPSRAQVVANGTTERWLAAGEAEVPRLGDVARAFVWTYAGNVGLSQDLETAIEAARILGSGFELRIAGDGARREALEEQAQRTPGARVRFEGLVEPEAAARLLRGSDALLVSLADDPALAKSIPIKLYDYCAIGRPVIVAATGEVRRIAEAEDVAIALDPGDPEALAEAVRSLRGDAGRAGELASRARDFAARNLRERGVERLESLLRGIAG